ncbi:hypothetical protein EDD18DRAFT_1364622 [Armillaria luteobubalina]|uniref:Uncharacterized protein n=1 Tax=Armillaria luteobubalina TaxID=153913 RepID=A0AA39P6V1_9AGAR|nr:hypothetical protein EDD18DRAFT_1364622 [Armillaria luteobubalina]
MKRWKGGAEPSHPPSRQLSEQNQYLRDGMVCQTAPAISTVGIPYREPSAIGDHPQTPHSVCLDRSSLTSSTMLPSTDTHPTNTAEIRSDAAPPPTLHDKTHSDSLTSTWDKPLPSLPSIRNANTLEESLRHQRGTLHSSFQRPVLTVETKGNLVHGGKFMHPHHTYAEPRNLSRNRQSFPPPYTAVDPNVPRPSSRAI